MLVLGYWQCWWIN